MLPLKLSKISFVGTSTVHFACVNAIKLIPYWALGQLSAANLKVAAALTPFSVVAVFACLYLTRILPEKRRGSRLPTGE